MESRHGDCNYQDNCAVENVNVKKLLSEITGLENILDIIELVEILSRIVQETSSSYHSTAQAALDLNSIALARKSDVKNAIERSRKLGRILDRLLVVYKKEVKILEFIFGK